MGNNRRRVLVVTSAEDRSADIIIGRLEAKGVAAVRFHPDEVGHTQDLSADRDGIILTIPAICFRGPPTDFSSIWYTRPIAKQAPSGSLAAFEARETQSVVSAFLHACRGSWHSHPEAIRRASDKLAQLMVARSVGFAVPDFVASNDPEALHDFFSKFAGDVVIKPVSSKSSLLVHNSRYSLLGTRRVSRDDIESLRRAGRLPCPVFLQRLVASRFDVRVTAIGDDVTPVAIYTDQSASIDTRMQWQGARHSVVEVPDDVVNKIRSFLSVFGLSFGAFDFLMGVDGTCWFLECNPVGQFTWLDQAAGTNLCAQLTDLLSRP